MNQRCDPCVDASAAITGLCYRCGQIENHPPTRGTTLPKTKQVLRDRLESIGYEGSWDKRAGLEAFIGMADQLMDAGFTEDEAVEFLDRAYGVVSAEFGA